TPAFRPARSSHHGRHKCVRRASVLTACFESLKGRCARLVARPIYVNMAVQSASPLFLRESEIRRGVELLYFGYSHLYRGIDEGLAKQGLGRAHHRALYFIARQPDLKVSDLLRILGITKQSLGRVLN